MTFQNDLWARDPVALEKLGGARGKCVAADLYYPSFKLLDVQLHERVWCKIFETDRETDKERIVE